MKLSFRVVATFTAVLAFLLASAWVFVPQLYLALWQLPYSEPVGVVMRRGGALFFAFACIFFLVRHAPPSPARHGLCVGTAIGLGALAAQAAYELFMSNVGPLVLGAFSVEVLLAGAFIAVAKPAAAAHKVVPGDGPASRPRT